MQRGVIFTIEAIYVLAIVFSALIIMMSSLRAIDAPAYDSIQAMKTAHDVGEAAYLMEQGAPDSPGAEYAIGSKCKGSAVAVMKYYTDSSGKPLVVCFV